MARGGGERHEVGQVVVGVDAATLPAMPGVEVALARARRALGAVGGPVADEVLDPRAGRALLQDRTAPSPLDALSEREREVLALVARGMPNKLIARELAISEKTVKAHLTQVFRAIGVTDRTQAALWAERNGLSAGS